MTTPAGRPSRVGLAVDGSIRQAELLGLCERVRNLVAAGTAATVICDARRVTDASLGTVALLASLQLAARRAGGRIEVRSASPDLRELLALVGLSDVVGLWPASGLEPQWQAEHREEASGIEEEGDSADPIA